MDSNEYYTVFDITQVGYKSWPFPAFGRIFIAVGVVLILLKKRGYIKASKSPSFDKWFPFFCFGFSVVWTGTAFFTTYVDYSRGVQAMRSNRAEIIEGVVTNFSRPRGHRLEIETFEVQGVKFEYAEDGKTAGFNTTVSHGGPIREGLPVKIWHLNGEILRLDVKEKPAMPTTTNLPEIIPDVGNH